MGSLLPSDVSGCLFRVAQEALQNIVRHSHAKTAVMELGLAGRPVRLRISDNGVGMDAERDEGLGLLNIREQVLAVDGTIEITSAPSKGTMIDVSVPVKASA